MPETRKTILVVDDQPEIRRLVSEMLDRQGFKVLSADTGENGINLFKAHPETELLLLDVVAPGMSGPMIADAIDALQPGIKVLFMSGYDSTQVVRRYVIERGYSLIIKPFRMDQLSKAVADALGGSIDAAGG